jgi:hypothetical protein
MLRKVRKVEDTHGAIPIEVGARAPSHRRRAACVCPLRAKEGKVEEVRAAVVIQIARKNVQARRGNRKTVKSMGLLAIAAAQSRLPGPQKPEAGLRPFSAAFQPMGCQYSQIPHIHHAGLVHISPVAPRIAS